MPDSSQRHRHWYKLLCVSRMQKQPKGSRTRLYEVRDEEPHRIPKDRDGKTSSISPCAVSARKNDHSNVDQRLQRVKNSQIGNKNRRKEKRQKEKCRSYVYPHLCRTKTIGTSVFHTHDLTYDCAA